MKNFLKKINIKLKLFLIFLGSILSVIFYLYFRNNLRLKQQFKYQLSKLKKEMELTELEKDSEEKILKIKDLKIQRKEIEDKIKIIEEKEISGKDISVEELENFFNERNF